jgi:ribosomal protein L7/L12
VVLKHLQIEYPDPAAIGGLSREVCELADDPARKIEAIKLHREQTGCSLKEAKDAVEAYMNRSS